MIISKKITAITPPSTGEMIQLEAIRKSSAQFTTLKPPATIPAPKIPPTSECVVETGAPIAVAKCNQTAPEARAASIKATKTRGSARWVESIMPDLIVSTTSPPAIIAPIASQIAAMRIAPTSVIA